MALPGLRPCVWPPNLRPAMETVRIETAQNVALQFEVATLVDRGLALVIDWVLLVGYSFGMVMLLRQSGAGPPEWLVITLFGVPWTFYHLLCELLMDGQSIGKRVRGIKVVRMDGGQPGLGHYLLRWLLRMVDSLFLVGAVVILFNGKGQRIGDLAAGTTVVSIKRRGTLDELLPTALPSDHRVTFPGAEQLSDAHARLIKEVLNDRSGARAQALAMLAERLGPQFGNGKDLPPETFLRTLLDDHNFLVGTRGMQ